MQKNRTLILAGALLATSPAAAQADREGAQRLLDAFETYLGRPGLAAQSSVSVEPAGDSYRVSIDLEAVARPLAHFGIELIASDVSFLTAPQLDGTWHVSDWPTSMSVEVKLPGQADAYRAEGVISEGIYDPDLQLFTTLTQTIASTTSQSSGPDNTSNTSQGEQRTEMTAVAVDDGVADVRVRQAVAGITTEDEFVLPGEAGAASTSTFRFSSRVQSADVDIRMNSLRSRTGAELWAFLVAHPSLARIEEAQGQLKSLLSAFLPVFGSIEQSGSARGITVATDFSSFAVDRIGGRLLLSGLVAGGSASTKMEVAGISLPKAIAPAWASGPIPTDFDIELLVSGYNFDAPVRQLIRDFDLSNEFPIDPAHVQSAFTHALAKDGLQVALAPSSIATPLVKVHFDGRMTVTGPAPVGRFNVRATGLDDAFEALQAAGSSDQRAAQVLATVSMAQAPGKPGPDGCTEWLVETRSDGSVTVNGRL